MNLLQFFHKKEELPMFNIGDKVRLKSGKAIDEVEKIYTKHYPKCYAQIKDWKKDVWQHLVDELGNKAHIVTKIEEGTPAAGGWFVYVDNIDVGYHGNIFELIRI